MKKIQWFMVLACMLAAANAWGTPFKDDFNRANGPVGNGWAIATNGTVTSQIVDNELLVSGTEATDWARCGISRAVSGETKFACDFKADNNFNFHFQLRLNVGSGGYIEIFTYPGGPLQYANSLDGGWPAAGWQVFPSNAQTLAGQYNNVVAELKDAVLTVTLNGKVCGTVANANLTRVGSVFVSSDAAAGTTGSLHLDNVQIGTVLPGKAKDPHPDSVSDVPRDGTLSWTAGKYAATHNVYLGTSLADVNTADLSKAVSKGQTGTTFQPAGVLEYGRTYYWRVDEVNAAPSTTVFKGDIWSFAVEPYAYPITNITATASSQDKSTTGPANTINGSGLTNDLHSTNANAMWLSSMTGAAPVWIQYQFDKVYKLQELWVWNHNTEFEPVLGYGFKDVTIETSTDGTTWTVLKDVQFAKATALAGDPHGTTVDLGGVTARYVRLTAKSNWSMVGLKQCGLSEVRFYHVPVQASAPQPAVNARDVSVNTSLDWRPGREVTSHTVVFGSDKAAVTGGTAPSQSVTGHGFTPAALEFGTTYYWKVDEVGTATYPGDVWKFVTQEYAVVDDFESYNDDLEAKTTIFDIWVDGLANGLSGSVVGNDTAPFAEQTILHGGEQSLPLAYDNSKAPYYSEAERTFGTPQDWTVSGATTLRLWLKGNPAKFVETAPGQYQVSSNSADVWGTADNFRFVYKTLAGDGSISAKVVALTDTTSNWAKAGVMIRNTLEENSSYAFMFPTRDGRRAFQNRPATGGNAVSAHSNTGVVSLPFWVKVERKGNQLTASYSTDGKTWTIQPATENTGADRSPNPQTIMMGASVYLGLAVASNNAAAQACVGQFSDVVTTGSVGGSWVVADLGPNSANDPAGLYVTVEDRTGKKATVVHPNPAASTFSAWTPWPIALSDLTGVNLAAVKKLTIGVGERSNPKAGGAGKLYLDDIGFGKPAVRDLTNYAVNGGFETGALAPWGSYGSIATTAVVTDLVGASVPEGPVEGSYCLNVKVSGPGANFWDAGFNSAAPTFTKGTKYTLSAFFKTRSGTGKVNIKPEHSATPWEGYGEKQITITDTWAEYYVTTPVLPADVSPASLTFHIGFQAQEFWVDNVKFYEGDYVPSK